MNITRHLIIACISVMSALNCHAQGYSPNSNERIRRANHGTMIQGFQSGDVYFGARIGVSFSYINSDIEYLDLNSSKTGLTIGGIVGFPLSDQVPVLFETGLSITQKGGTSTVDSTKVSCNMGYLELPFVFKYRFDVTDEFTIQPLVGGYFALGLGGKTKDYETRTATGSFSSNKFGIFDAGLRLGCGFSYDMIYAELAYELGLVNTCHDAFDTSHNGSLQLSVGINF